MSTTARRSRLGLIVALVAVGASVATPPTAHSFPGMNGRFVTEVVGEGDPDNIGAVDPNGANFTPLTNATDSPWASSPVWSPDGTQIAFEALNPEYYPPMSIYVMNADGGARRQLTFPLVGGDFNPAWTPDGRRLSFTRLTSVPGGVELLAVNADGTGEQQLLTDLPHPLPSYATAVWSPDGSRLAFEYVLDGVRGIYSARPDGSDLRAIATTSDGVEFAARPEWSPDGEAVAFRGDSGLGDGEDGLVIANRHGGGIRHIEGSATHEGIHAAWSPDGTKLAWATEAFGWQNYVFTLDGSQPRETVPRTCDGLRCVGHVWDWAPVPRYRLSGFLAPVKNRDDNDQYIVNSVRAGSSVPLKFGLGGNYGLGVLAAEFPKSRTIGCDGEAPWGALTSTQATKPLSYDTGTGIYSYTWQTERAWRGTCRQFVLKLDDHTYQRANFSFR
jgi:Tol biopolymer transport system component